MPSAITSRPAGEPPPADIDPAVTADAERRFAEDQAALPASLARGLTAEDYARFGPDRAALSGEKIAAAKLQGRSDAAGETMSDRDADALVRQLGGIAS